MKPVKYLSYVDGIRDMDIDSMHAIYLNVWLHMMKLWWSPFYSDKPFSLYKYIDEASILSKSFSYPHSKIARLPRKLDNFEDWKAGELRDWLFYIASGVLHKFMQRDYFIHAKLFIDSIKVITFPFKVQILHSIQRKVQSFPCENY